MLKQQSQPLLHNKNNAGFSLVEAMISMALVGIAFAASYMMISFSEKTLQKTIAKQKLQIMAEQISENAENEISNLDSYSDISLDNCEEIITTNTSILINAKILAKNLCTKIKKFGGAKKDNELRKIDVVDQGGNKKVLNITLEALNGDVTIVTKKIFHAK